MTTLECIEEFTGHEPDTIHSFDLDEVIKLMQSFATNHVKLALKEALESIPCLGSSTDIATYEEVEEAVLNSYDLNNIK